MIEVDEQLRILEEKENGEWKKLRQLIREVNEENDLEEAARQFFIPYYQTLPTRTFWQRIRRAIYEARSPDTQLIREIIWGEDKKRNEKPRGSCSLKT